MQSGFGRSLIAVESVELFRATEPTIRVERRRYAGLLAAGSSGGEPPPVSTPRSASTTPVQKPAPQARCITAKVGGTSLRTTAGCPVLAWMPATTHAAAYVA